MNANYKEHGSRRRKRLLIQLMARVRAWWTSNGDRKRRRKRRLSRDTTRVRFRDAKPAINGYTRGSVDWLLEKQNRLIIASIAPFRSLATLNSVSWKNNEATRELLPSSSPRARRTLLYRFAWPENFFLAVSRVFMYLRTRRRVTLHLKITRDTW